MNAKGWTLQSMYSKASRLTKNLALAE